MVNFDFLIRKLVILIFLKQGIYDFFFFLKMGKYLHPKKIALPYNKIINIKNQNKTKLGTRY